MKPRQRIVLCALTLVLAGCSSDSVEPDTTPPSATITAPASGEVLTEAIVITVAASDAGGVASVSFRVDGILLGEDALAPWAQLWNPGFLADGQPHLLEAAATDMAGNSGNAEPVLVLASALHPAQLATLLPADSTVFIDTPVVLLTWSAIPGATDYQVEIAHDALFAETYTSFISPDTCATIGPLPQAWYHWRGRGRDATGVWSGWGGTSCFHIGPVNKRLILGAVAK